MKTFRLLFGLIALLALVASRSFAQSDDPRFESAIQQMLKADAEKPPQHGAIFFVGSSIFRQWTNVSEMMAPLPVYNRAFGGSRTQDQVDRFQQIVRPHAPRLIVYYCGSNDIRGGVSPDEAFARFERFSKLVREFLPDTHLLFVASNRSPDRKDKFALVNRYNELAEKLCTTTPNHHYFDANPVLLGPGDEPRAGFFKSDNLHLNPPAYVAFAAALKPEIEKIWTSVSAVPAAAAKH